MSLNVLLAFYSFHHKNNNPYIIIHHSYSSLIFNIKFRISNFNEDQINKILKKFINQNLILKNNDIYYITEHGFIFLKDILKYYINIIWKNWIKYKRCNKKYSYKEIRTEQCKLRQYLVLNKKNQCVVMWSDQFCNDWPMKPRHHTQQLV